MNHDTCKNKNNKMETINLNDFVSVNFGNLNDFEENAVIGSCQTFDETYYKVLVDEDAETLTAEELREEFNV